MVKVVLLCFNSTRFGSINSSFVSLCQAAATADSLLHKEFGGEQCGLPSWPGQFFPGSFALEPLSPSGVQKLLFSSWRTDRRFRGKLELLSRWGSEKKKKTTTQKSPQRSRGKTWMSSLFLFLSWLRTMSMQNLKKGSQQRLLWTPYLKHFLGPSMLKNCQQSPSDVTKWHRVLSDATADPFASYLQEAQQSLSFFVFVFFKVGGC